MNRMQYRLLLREEMESRARMKSFAGLCAWATFVAGLLALWLLCSCTVINHPTAGYYASLGGDTSGMKSDASGYSFNSNSNSAAFKDVIKQVRLSWQSYLVAEGLKFLSGRYYDHEGKIVDAGTTVKLEELRNARSLAESNAALETLKLTTP